MRRLLVVLFLFATAARRRRSRRTDGTSVLWWANGCLLLADVSEPRANAIGKLRIGPKAFRHIRHERGTSLPVQLRTDDGDRTPANTTQVVWVRE
jgi:hypothetical protein